VLTILVRDTPEELHVGGLDKLLLGAQRVRHYRWPGTSIEEAVLATARCYTPQRCKEPTRTLGPPRRCREPSPPSSNTSD
jgi:hypothetical protein